jgi:hypothetical protein
MPCSPGLFPYTCIILIALGNFSQQLGNGRAHCFGAIAKVLGTLFHLQMKGVRGDTEFRVRRRKKRKGT